LLRLAQLSVYGDAQVTFARNRCVTGLKVVIL